jgi:3-dehydroquinate dehydratase-2
MKIMVIHGPNLNMLGLREPEIYGRQTYRELCAHIEKAGEDLGHSISCVQSNCEGQLIDYIQEAFFAGYDGIIINPGAYTHYSYAIYDALKSVPVPAVEVHLSDIQNREEFRKVSVIAPACIGQISGKGQRGYLEAMQLLANH